MPQAVGSWLATSPGVATGPGLALVGTWVAVALTLAVLSYLLGRNPLFRLAEYLFVGVAAGYAAGLAWHHALWPRIGLLMADPYRYWYYGLFMVLGFLLLARGVRPLEALGDVPLGMMVGTGAGLALGGALTGSLVAQMRAAVVSLAPAHYGGGVIGWAAVLDAALLLVGTLAVLSAFHFTTQGNDPLSALGLKLLNRLGRLGRGLILVALGASLAGALFSFYAILHSRLAFVYAAFQQLLGF
ncbi:MAG: hypothetical protein V1772_02500 [Chloroflexota bacterium]